MHLMYKSFAVLCKRLEHLGILVSMRVLEPIPPGYQRTTIFDAHIADA